VRDGHWQRVATRSCGTVVYRVTGRFSYYVKTAAPQDGKDLRFHPPGEAARLSWLAARGIPVPEVVEVGATADTAWLVTTAIAGRPASGPWGAADRGSVLHIVADLAQALHALPVQECPFDRTLAVSLPLARAAARSDLVDLDDRDDRHAGWTPQQLLDELDATPPPVEDHIVVCHGDLCLDNILIAPDTLVLAGVLDVGRLGVADRWLDLAITLRNITEECRGSYPGPQDAVRFLRRYGLAEIDAPKAFYYRLLDEFA
jgi:aminoglycoside phosphotransferase